MKVKEVDFDQTFFSEENSHSAENPTLMKQPERCVERKLLDTFKHVRFQKRSSYAERLKMKARYVEF